MKKYFIFFFLLSVYFVSESADKKSGNDFNYFEDNGSDSDDTVNKPGVKSLEKNLTKVPDLIGKSVYKIPKIIIDTKSYHHVWDARNDLKKIDYWTGNEKLEEIFKNLRKSKSPNPVSSIIKLPDQNKDLKKPFDLMYDIISVSLLKSESGLNFSKDVFGVSYGSASVEPTIRILRDIFKDEKYQSLKHFFVNSFVKDDPRSTNVAAYLLQSALENDQNAELYTSKSFGQNKNDALFDDQEDLDLLPKNHADDNKKNQPIDFFISVDEDLAEKDYKKVVKNLNQSGSLFVHIDKKGNMVFLCFDIITNLENTRSAEACRYLSITNPNTNITYEISFWDDEIKYSPTFKGDLSISEDLDYLKHGGPRGSIRKDTLFYDLQQSNNINEFLKKFFKKIEKNEPSINQNTTNKIQEITSTKTKDKSRASKDKDKLPLIINVVATLCVLGIIGVISWPFIKNLWNEHKNKMNF